MSRRKKDSQQQPAAEPVSATVAGEQSSAAGIVAMAAKSIDAQFSDPAQLIKMTAKREVKPHLRCPCCWNGYGGKAARRKWQRQVSGPLAQRCYVCDQCAAEWVVDVRAEEIDGIEWVQIKTNRVRTPMPRA